MRRPGPGAGRRRGHPGLLLLLALVSVFLPRAGEAQDPSRQDVLQVGGTDGAVRSIPIVRHQGYPAVAASALAVLGVRVEPLGQDRAALHLPGGEEIRLAEGNPFVGIGDELLQVMDPPYRMGDELFVPVHLLTDLLPDRLPAAFRMDAGVLRLSAAGPPVQLGARPDVPSPAQGEVRAPRPAPVPVPDHARVETPVRRVVVVDAGHGGNEPGAVGPGGTREKTIALGVALALAEELRKNPSLEVHLTRDSDVAVPLWERGEIATRLKGDGHGVFVSIHANSVGGRASARGFETYFLAEARTDDARRVAAIENAPLRQPGSPDEPDLLDPGLNSILNELRMLDHQHWSALLAEFVQQELSTFHPGPNRGVKQGPFAVLTNALMPSVLIELGFISNRDEERLMGRSDFQVESARAIASALNRFFQRYPPGQGSAPLGDGP